LLYLLGYFLAGLSFTTGITAILTTLHRKASFRSVHRVLREPPELKKRAVITFSMVLPFAALSFLLLIFNPMNIAQSIHTEGHYGFVLEALLMPVICFLVGYCYFRRMVRP
jgi:sterol desaturase/sphingolipid hydroxylase (fatty acid hydroxylase superfamily)